MKFDPFVINKDGERVSVKILPMSSEDAESTLGSLVWQTDWTTDYISQSNFLKYALKTYGGELIGLAAYEIRRAQIVVHIAYMESEPASNPTIVCEREQRKYHDIGKVLIAFGIKLSIDNSFGGDVTLEAKTPELASHYQSVYGALPLPARVGSAPLYLICDEAARNIFFDYLS